MSLYFYFAGKLFFLNTFFFAYFLPLSLSFKPAYFFILFPFDPLKCEGITANEFGNDRSSPRLQPHVRAYTICQSKKNKQIRRLLFPESLSRYFGSFWTYSHLLQNLPDCFLFFSFSSAYQAKAHADPDVNLFHMKRRTVLVLNIPSPFLFLCVRKITCSVLATNFSLILLA